METALSAFLAATPLVDDVFQISPARPFQHDEEQYDQHRPADHYDPEFVRRQGATLMEFFHRHGHPAGAPILEIGCGSGWMSAALASQPDAGPLLVTDPSPAFIRMTRRRLTPDLVRAPRVDCGLLLAEDVDRIPPGAVSLIFLRSVLHHILDVDDFLARCAKILPPGGRLVCEEPYYDGYIMLGFLAQFIPDALASAGDACTPEELHLVNEFIATMQYYGRRDVDKSQAEDKHLFRPDELFVSGARVALDLVHHPNWHIAIEPARNLSNRTGYFKKFFAMYIRNCMNWPQPFCDRVTAATQKYFRFFEPLETETNVGPYCFGTFVFTKRR